MAEDPKLVLVKWHADVAHLRDLLQQEGWDVYAGYIQRLEQEAVELLLTADSPGPATDWRKGYVAGLRRAIKAPHEVIQNVSNTRH